MKKKDLLLADFASLEIKATIKITGGDGILKLSGSAGDEDDDSEGV